MKKVIQLSECQLRSVDVTCARTSAEVPVAKSNFLKHTCSHLSAILWAFPTRSCGRCHVRCIRPELTIALSRGYDQCSVRCACPEMRS